MNQLKISTRLATLITVMGLLLVLIGGFGLYGMTQSDDALDKMYNGPVSQVAQISELRYLTLRNRLVIANAVIEQTAERSGKSVSEVEANLAQISKVWTTYMATPMPPDEARMAKGLDDKLNRHIKEGVTPTLAALRANDYKEAHRLVVEVIRPTFDAAREQSDAMLKFNLDEAKANFEAESAQFHTIRNISIVSIVLGLLFSLAFGVALLRSIT
ncbi:Tar ligand binding domain-containing protein, partial [Rhodoferax sp.]|uniref:Tar ligand binding domain-containing protein n=1 Tax=Rhodoferax sp. TaxID=50421 RepID=UPI00263983CB